MTIGFIFSLAPFGSVAGREGLDAVLATSNYSEDLALFFIGDGVLQLLSEQNPSALYCRDHVKTFKMLPMCDIENIYLCQDSLIERGLHDASFVLNAQLLSSQAMAERMRQCSKILRF